MRTNQLTLIAISIFVTLIIFIVFIYLINLISESPQFQGYIGGGPIDFDPDLSPSYALDFTGYLKFNSIFVMVPIQLGIISLLLIIPHLILKKKKIPSRPYVSLIAAAIMLFIGIPSSIQGVLHLFIILTNEHFRTMEYISATVPFMVFGFILVGGGMAFLTKSKSLRNFMVRK